MINERGEEVHPRLVSMYKLRHPDKYGDKTMKQIMDDLGWKTLEGTQKHRYCFLRGDKKQRKLLHKQIEQSIMEYPK